MELTFPDEKKNAVLASIKHYFLEQRDEEIGELAAGLFLDFVLEEIGPSIYNQGIKDAQASLQRIVADLDLNLCIPEPIQ